MNEFLIIIDFGFKGHGHLRMSFFSRKKLLFVGGFLAAGREDISNFELRISDFQFRNFKPNL